MGPAYESTIEEYFNARGAAGAGGVTVTKAAPSGAGDVYSVTGIQCSGDAAALVTIESPASTLIYAKRFAGAFVMSEEFSPGTMKGAAGQAVLVKVSASTTACEAQIQGHRLAG